MIKFKNYRLSKINNKIKFSLIYKKLVLQITLVLMLNNLY